MLEVRYLRAKQVLEKFPMGRSTLWWKVKRGDFPKPFKLSSRTTVWDSAELDSWAAEKKEQSNG